MTTLEHAIPPTPLVEIIVKDDLTQTGAARLLMLLTDALDMRPQQLVVDLGGCQLADAGAVDVLLTIHRRAWAIGSRLTLRAPSPRMRRLLKLTRTEHVFNVTAMPGGTGVADEERTTP